jgi:hypothetical protein
MIERVRATAGLLGAGTIAALYLVLLAPPLAMPDFEAQQGELMREGVIAPFTFEVRVSGEELDALSGTVEQSVPLYLVYESGVWPTFGTVLEARLLQVTGDTVYVEGLISDLSVMYDKGVVDLERVSQSFDGNLAVLTRGSEDGAPVPLSSLNLHRLTEVVAAFSSALRGGGLSQDLADSVAGALLPNVAVDAPRREEALESALEDISRVDTVIVAGDTIIPPGGVVSERTLGYIEAMRSAQTEGMAGRRLRYTFGRLLLLAGIMALATFYTRDSMPDTWASSSRLLLLCTTWSISIAGTGLLWLLLGQFYRGSYAALVTFGAVHSSVFFHRRHAAVFSFLFAALTAMGQPHPYSSMLVTAVSGALAGYAVWDLRKRSSILNSVILSTAGGALTLLLCRLLDIGLVGTPLWIGLMECFLSPIAGIGAATSLLFAFEKLFSASTVLTIEEARNRDHVLLRELSKWAMGTWQHSQQVADLASQAARAVGASASLAEAGGLFHDVGKVQDPRHFIENIQPGAPNPHDELHPLESARRLMAHVTEGVRLARKAKVPLPVVDIIATHHGTTCMKAFYEKARAAAGPEGEPSTDLFRYHGPKPRSVEAAIVMLADAVDSATKNMTSATTEELDETVRELIEERDADGQLDDCHITRGNLKSIRTAFLEVLNGRFHERVRDYPHGPDNR